MIRRAPRSTLFPYPTLVRSDPEGAEKEDMPSDLATRKDDGSVQPISSEKKETYQGGLERFLDEAKAIAQFQHPNIVRVRSVFEAKNTA